jgi:hypothetical protein
VLGGHAQQQAQRQRRLKAEAAKVAKVREAELVEIFMTGEKFKSNIKITTIRVSLLLQERIPFLQIKGIEKKKPRRL